MNSNSRFWLSTQSPLAWGFLFLVVIVLPTLVVRHAWMAGIEERYQAELDRLRGVLVEEGRRFVRAKEPDLAMGTLLERWGRSEGRFFEQIARLERAHPEAFRWICWNIDGGLISLPFSLEMKGRRLWQEIVPRYLGRLMLGRRVLGGGVESDSTVAALQVLIGSELKTDDLFQTMGRFMEARVAGTRHQLFWKWLKVPTSALTGTSKSRDIAGALVFVRPDKLPPSFWLRQTLLNSMGSPSSKAVRFAMIDLQHPGHGFADARISAKHRFLRELRRRYLGRSGDSFIAERHLIVPTPAGAGEGERVFVMAPLAGILDARRREQERTDGLTLLAVFLGLSASIGVRFGAARNLSLRWRITGLFALAVLLPLSGILYLGMTLTARETERLRSLSFSSMKSASDQLEARFADFPIRYGRSVARKVERAAALSRNTTELGHKLEKMRLASDIFAYYLSDEKGGTATWSASVDDPNTQNMLKLLLRNAFLDAYGFAGGKTILGDVLADEARGMSSGDGTDIRSGTLLRSALKRQQFGRVQRWLMFLPIRLGGASRMACLEVGPFRLERAFAMAEIRKNRFAARRGVDSAQQCDTLFIASWGGKYQFLPASDTFEVPAAIAQAAGFPEEAHGESEIDGKPYLFHLARNVWFQSRPLFLSSLAPIQADARERRTRVRVMISLAGAAALVLGLVLAGMLLAPIGRLDAAVRQIGDGDLAVALPETGGDEIGRLGRNFNLMVRGLRERERMRAYVSETVLEAVRDEGGGLRKNDGEIREVTVLFSDIRDFTTISERETPERVFAMLNEFLGGAEEEIRRFGGRVDKFIGDAVMAVFPEPGPEGAWAAVRAALALHAFLARFNVGRRERGLFPIEIGIGINTGRVMLGDVGSARRKDLTVIGDEVNLAARLESASKYGRFTRIVLSERTCDCVRDRVTVEEMAITEVKGKKAPVRMFELIGPVEKEAPVGDS